MQTTQMIRHLPEEDIQRANQNMKRFSIALIVIEMPNKTTMKYYYTPTGLAKLKKSQNVSVRM